VEAKYRKLRPAWVLAHEYVHSWNGKYRRPDGLATPDFQKPMRTRLLWVYEGLTQYYGLVLAARSGLHEPVAARDNLAIIADWASNQRGRDWRPLDDTATAAPFLYASRDEWSHRRRGVDFYDEGALLWLDADTLIREKSGGQKSLDDFARSFYGGSSGQPEVRPYTYEDVVKALDAVVPYDWHSFLERRLTATGPEAPLDGISRGGWRVVYKPERSSLLTELEGDQKVVDLTASVGLLLKEDGGVVDVVPGKAADKAGIGPHMKLLAVNGRRLSPERLREAVTATAGGKGKLALLVENGDYMQTRDLDYNGGARYPHLERDPAKPDRIAEIFAAKSASK
jgi:predicted metalloprotease with PDZ domain